MATVARERGIWSVIGSSSAGTLIEWYDFYLFGSLATVMASQFFPKGNDLASLLSTLAIFGAGFVVRPFGALVFGRLGDLVGRKFTFLFTLITMGLSTVLIGVVPNYEMIGVAAPILVLILRLVQGLAVGGEYGGAATYVAENAPVGKRGFYTSFIQTTATLGLFVSLLVILFTRNSLGDAPFNQWGWRIPFLLSSVLVIFSYLIRRRMEESPLFAKLKATGKTSTNPLKESFGNPANRRMVLIALFGATAGQGVVWYTGQFYALTYLQTIVNLQSDAAYKIIACALVLATPFFVVFGGLSDKIGRKKLMMAACLLAAIFYVPIFSAMKSVVPTVETLGTPKVEIKSTTDPITKKTDVSKNETWSQDGTTVTKKTMVSAVDLSPLPKEKPKTTVTPNTTTFFTLVGLVWLLVFLVTMIYGPIAAFLVELFPTRIRYTSMSLPYHIGNGVFGGLVPYIATQTAALANNPVAGLAYPIAIALITFVVGSIFIKEHKTAEGFEEDAD